MDQFPAILLYIVVCRPTDQSPSGWKLCISDLASCAKFGCMRITFPLTRDGSKLHVLKDYGPAGNMQDSDQIKKRFRYAFEQEIISRPKFCNKHEDSWIDKPK